LCKDGMPVDIAFNTHCLPSRMTPGKLVEMMLGKLGVARGEFQDGTPFTVSEEWGDDDSSSSVIDKLGDALAACGMRRDGREACFDGVSGIMMTSDVFVGPCSIMKLNHDVQGKIHARARGPKVVATNQPVEGRAFNGGNRLGEMEAQCMVSHGSSAVLQERHRESSDKMYAPICIKCGLPGGVPPKKMAAGAFGALESNSAYAGSTYCHHCQEYNTTKMVPTPGGFHLFNHTLAALHIKMKQEVKKDVPSLCPRQ
jgi:DNA-directed RNA polymerase beta subunit